MNLNTITYEPGSKSAKKRLGRGIGSGLGKTSGRGHKGQKARAGGYHKIYFEGGQMPIQRRMPKSGFKSYKSRLTAQLTLSDLTNIGDDLINLDFLKQKGIINNQIKYVKVIHSGEISSPIKIKGIKVTKGAREAILNAGGNIEE